MDRARRPPTCRLIEIPQARTRIDGDTIIEPGYPRDYTPEQMRAWAEDLERYHHTSPSERAAWRALEPNQLSQTQRGILRVEDTLYVSADRGINGTLRDDQIVELNGGRHRAGYMLERGVDPIPVWVRCNEPRQLEAFRVQCERELDRSRIAEADRRPPDDRDRPTRDELRR